MGNQARAHRGRQKSPGKKCPPGRPSPPSRSANTYLLHICVHVRFLLEHRPGMHRRSVGTRVPKCCRPGAKHAPPTHYGPRETVVLHPGGGGKCLTRIALSSCQTQYSTHESSAILMAPLVTYLNPLGEPPAGLFPSLGGGCEVGDRLSYWLAGEETRRKTGRR